MLYTHYLASTKKTVGIRQTMKAIEKGLADKVFIAKDAEKRVVLPVINACQNKGISIVEVETMSELGKACSVQVLTAVAACLKE
ncbi:MAG: ribosomal L7Ae/L30e/S12e/Gadd45 family protein [Bacillota bacterium]